MHTAIAYDIIVCEEVYMISYIISYVISYCISYDIALQFAHTDIAYDIIVFAYDIIVHIIL